MNAQEFEKVVRDELNHIPDEWKSVMKNIAIIVEDEPDAETRREQGLDKHETLLGLYRGIPTIERGDSYGIGVTLPDSITLYRLPILEEARDDAGIARIVIRETLWHEIAHHFGFSEESVELREARKTNRFRKRQ